MLTQNCTRCHKPLTEVDDTWRKNASVDLPPSDLCFACRGAQAFEAYTPTAREAPDFKYWHTWETYVPVDVNGFITDWVMRRNNRAMPMAQAIRFGVTGSQTLTVQVPVELQNLAATILRPNGSEWIIQLNPGSSSEQTQAIRVSCHKCGTVGTAHIGCDKINEHDLYSLRPPLINWKMQWVDTHSVKGMVLRFLCSDCRPEHEDETTSHQ